MRSVRTLLTDQSGEGTSGGALVAIVLLVIALIGLVVYFMGGFSGSGEDADIEIDLDADRGSSSVLPARSDRVADGRDWQVRLLS